MTPMHTLWIMHGARFFILHHLMCMGQNFDAVLRVGCSRGRGSSQMTRSTVVDEATDFGAGRVGPQRM